VPSTMALARPVSVRSGPKSTNETGTSTSTTASPDSGSHAQADSVAPFSRAYSPAMASGVHPRGRAIS
jgi:hypothetical protein